MVFKPNRLIPGHLVKIKDRKTKEPLKNVWEIVLEISRDSNGNRNRKTFRFIGGKKEADAELQRLRKEYSNQNIVEPSNITLSAYLGQWIESAKSDGSEYTLRHRTWDSYKEMIEKHIIPELGSILLSELTAQHIAIYKEKKLCDGGRLDKKKGGLSGTTVNKHLVVLNQALENAASPEKQLIPVNPMRLVKRVGKKGMGSKRWKASENYLDLKQLKDLLSKIKNYNIFPIVFIAAYTGMRMSEILGLRWRDVSFKKREITVAQSAHHGKNGYHINPTKNSRPRIIAVSQKVIDLLEELKKKQQKTSQVYNLNQIIFVRQDGQAYKRNTVSTIFRDAAKLYGFPISFHGLRHTHATLLLTIGVPVHLVSQRLGHTQYSTTLNEYAHAIPASQTEVAVVFDKIMALGEANILGIDQKIADLFDDVVHDENVQ